MAFLRGKLDQRFGEHAPCPPLVKRKKLFIDIETYCDLDLKAFGLDRYSSHPSFEVLMMAYCANGRDVDIWDIAGGEKMPRELKDAFDDPDVEIHAFNAQFERVCLKRGLGLKFKMRRWRCTMVLAYLHSYFGGLDQVVTQMELPAKYHKDARGTALMKMFSFPQRITKKQPLRRLDYLSHPIQWEEYKDYCVQDVIAEMGIDRELDRPEYPIPEREWHFYAVDQLINDRGMPVDMEFVESAIWLSDRRKAELQREMIALTGLSNPNSGAQLLPWLKERGYPFDDIRKDSIVKVLAGHFAFQEGSIDGSNGELCPVLTDECVEGLKLRQASARTSVKKYDAIKKRAGLDNRIRYVFQFAGASRTARFAGRGFQPQNLTTMRDIDSVEVLEIIVEAIRSRDLEYLKLLRKEPLDALAGSVRASIRVHNKKKRLVVCDYSSIESVVIGWVARCERLLNVFRDGKDAYKDFATELYQIAYEAVTKDQRKKSKPATLGSGYRLGGGDLNEEGKKTGLWGYGENMGIHMTRQEAHKATKIFRKVYKEIPVCWYDLEDAIIKCIKNRAPTRVGFIRFSYEAPYLLCHLPSGRVIYYRKPQVRMRPFTFKDPETGEKKTIEKQSISYMGKQQNGSNWIRVYSHGGKFIENIVQAIARDILREGLMILHKLGFNVIGHVHDEAIAEEDADSEFDLDYMREAMIRAIAWLKNCPLNAAGWMGLFYRKD